MSKCPHCLKELPPLDRETIMTMLKKIPNLMEKLGKTATKAYIKKLEGVDRDHQ